MLTRPFSSLKDFDRRGETIELRPRLQSRKPHDLATREARKRLVCSAWSGGGSSLWSGGGSARRAGIADIDGRRLRHNRWTEGS